MTSTIARRSFARLAASIGLARALVLTAVSARAAGPTATQQIADLMLCYARGTDAIGNATTHPDPRQAGLDIYRECFLEDAVFRVWFPLQPFDDPVFPDPDFGAGPSATLTGPENRADFVNGVFRGNGYDFTQHVISNIAVEVRGKEAALVAYLNASHVIQGEVDPGATPLQCVGVANGTYSLGVVKTGSGWRIESLDLTLITFDPVFQSGEGCG